MHTNINKCLYCGDKGETDEHVIPFSLGGKVVLKNASCEKCRQLTSRYERHPLHEVWSAARAVLDYPSRKRDFDSETFTMNVVLKDGTEKILTLKRNETIGLASFLEYTLPAFFGSTGYTSGVRICGNRLIGFGPDCKAFVEKHNIKELRFQTEHKRNDMETMIARVAYCSAVAIFGPDAFEKVYVLPAILDKKDDVGFWMGCDPEGKIIPLIGKMNSYNVVKVDVWKRKGEDFSHAVVRIKFFANSDSPEYIVVVGKLQEEFSFSQDEDDKLKHF